MSRSLVRFAQPLMYRIKSRCSFLSPQRLQLAFRKLLPTFLVLTIASVAHAQGTMDFSGATTLMSTFKTSVLKIVREGAEKNGFSVEGFAPTSRAAGQLRKAGIEATTLQSFLARRVEMPDDQPEKHLYMLDEASLTSTRQMRDFLEKLKPEDRLLIIGDTHQHQGVDAGRPFEQLQDAGMRTALLDRIMRQKDTELLKAVEHLSRNETQLGIELLKEQGRVTQVADRAERIAAIARNYAESPRGCVRRLSRQQESTGD